MRSLFVTLSLVTLSLSIASTASAANGTDVGVRFTNVSFRNGSTGIYTISVSNNGPLATNDVVTASLVLPDGISLLASGGADFSCSASGQAVSCARSTPMSSGTTATFQVRVNVCSTVTRVSTTVKVSYSNDTNTSNNQTSRGTSVRLGPCQSTPTPTRTPTVPTATPTAANTPILPGSPIATRTPTLAPTATATPSPIPALTDLSITKTVFGSFRVGASASYFLVVSNNGPLATNIPITISDPLPNGLVFVSSSGDGWSCSASGQNVTCTFADPLTAGSTTGVTLTVAVGRSAYPTVTNIATLNYAGDTDLSNNTARRPTTIRS